MVPSLLTAPADVLLTPEGTSGNDALVVVAHAPISAHVSRLGAVAGPAIEALLGADGAIARGGKAAVVWPVPGAPGGRIVLGAMGALADDTDDVRGIAEATSAAVARAVDAGSQRPLLVVIAPESPRYRHAIEVAALAALAGQWSPLEAREAGKARPCAASITVAGLSEAAAARIAAIEAARALCRDIAGTEPERMAPRRAAALCREAFVSSPVAVDVIEDVSAYPLLAAVARASQEVPRHKPCIVELRHEPPGARRTIVLVGKGVTYDTGGADLKTDGAMAGMSRDKGGAAAVAGIVRAASLLGLSGVRVIGLLGLVRNSIGESGYVSDEIIVSRAGVRVRIGNTDAEGRLVLADLLCRAKEIASAAPSPLIVSIATLTGHVYRAYGPYTGVLANRAAREQSWVDSLDRLGELWGEPIERSRPRREDYAFVAPKSAAEDVLSSNRLASVATPRGHQFPFAFLDIASGLKNAGIPFMHLDIGGSAYSPPDWQVGTPTAVPVALFSALLGEIAAEGAPNAA